MNKEAEMQTQRAVFMEALYQYYKPANHHFTGLWEKYKQDLAEFNRDYLFLSGKDPRFNAKHLFASTAIMGIQSAWVGPDIYGLQEGSES